MQLVINFFNKRAKLFPLIIYIGIIPFIVRTKELKFPYMNYLWCDTKVGFDIFAFYKSVFIIGIGFIVLLRLLYLYLKHEIDFKNKYIKLLLTSIFLVVLSYAFSNNQVIAAFGFKDRFEGTYVMISYIVIVIYAIVEIKSIDEIKFVLKISGVFIGVLSIIGVLQYFKFDIFQYNFGKLILISKEEVDDLIFKSQIGRVYMTLYNPNYVGTYFALTAPIFSHYFINHKNRIISILFGIIYLFLVFSLAGSGSKGGFIGSIIGLSFLTIYNYFRKDKNKTLIRTGKIIMVILSFLLIFMLHNNNASRVKNIFKEDIKGSSLDKIYTFENTVYFKYDGNDYFIKETLDHHYKLYDGKFYNYKNKDFIINDKPIDIPKDISIQEVELGNDERSFILIFNENIKWPFIKTDDGLKYINQNIYTVSLIENDFIDVGNRESMGSGRVYIWSRSIPLLKDTLLIGNGADTYAVIFPQTDYVGKFKGFGHSNRISETIVDKPHNLYLQFGINYGMLFLIIYLFINFMTIKELFYLINKEIYKELSIIFISILICYGFTMFFNDSAVVVSSIYWAILGLAITLIKLESWDNNKAFE